MSYQTLTPEEYKSMTLECKIIEIEEWMEDQLANHQAIINSIAGTHPETNEELASVIDADFKNLPKMINDFENDSLEHAILKYRLDNNIVSCEDKILTQNFVGEKVIALCEYADSESDIATIESQRSLVDDMITLGTILGFDCLVQSFKS